MIAIRSARHTAAVFKPRRLRRGFSRSSRSDRLLNKLMAWNEPLIQLEARKRFLAHAIAIVHAGFGEPFDRGRVPIFVQKGAGAAVIDLGLARVEASCADSDAFDFAHDDSVLL